MRLKKGAKIAIVVVLLLVVVGGLIWYFNFRDGKEKVEVAKVVNEISEYGYQLKDNKSEAYKKLFQELKEVLESDSIDEEAYAKLISQMFIMDFYTLDDKVAKTDVGGADFVHSEEREDFLEQAMDTVYKYVESNLYGDRKQELPTVKEVVVDQIETIEFDYLDQTDANAYQVSVSWDYKKDLGYETEATLIIVHEGNKLSIVEMD